MSLATDATSELVAAIDTLSALDPAVLADGDTLVAISRQCERLSAIRARIAGAFDASGE